MEDEFRHGGEMGWKEFCFRVEILSKLWLKNLNNLEARLLSGFVGI